MAHLRGKSYRLLSTWAEGERVSREIISSKRSSTRVWGQRPGQPRESITFFLKISAVLLLNLHTFVDIMWMHFWILFLTSV